MKKRLEDMSLADIFNQLGKLISPESTYFLIDDIETLDKYSKLHDIFEENKEKNREKLYEFLMAEEDKIDKKKLVLLTLEQYLNARTISNLYHENKRIYDYKIEECKKLLDGEDVSLYRHKVDEETGRVQAIVETSSVELCAMKIDNPMKNTKQVKLDTRREDTEKQRKETIKRRRTKHSNRLQNIEKDISLGYILQFMILTDIEDALVSDRYLGEVLKYKIIRNTIIRESHYTSQELKEILLSERLEDEARRLKPHAFLEEFEDVIKEYAEYFDIDKLLLCSAYRAIETLSASKHTEEELEGTRNILEEIFNKLEGKNPRISAEIEDLDGKMHPIKYDKNKLKYDLNRFVSTDIFLSDQVIQETKNDILIGKVFLKDIKPEVLSMLQLTQEQWDKAVKTSSENFIYYLEKFEYRDEDIKEVIRDIKHINTQCLYTLIKRNCVDNEQIIQETVNRKVDLNTLIELASIHEIDDEIIINSFNGLQENGAEEENLSKNSLLKYFNIQKIQEMTKNSQIDDKFLDFYMEILPEEQSDKEIVLNEIKKTVSLVNDKNILAKFYVRGFITEDELIGKLTENDILELYENKVININHVNKMHEKNMINQECRLLIVEEEYQGSNILDLLEEGSIDLQTAIDMYTEFYDEKQIRNIFKGYTEETYQTSKPALFGFVTSQLSIEELDVLYKQGKVTEEELFKVAQSGNLRFSQIMNLYINTLISEDKIDQLVDENIISATASNRIKKALDMKNIAKNIDKSLGIEFSSEDEVEVDGGIFLPEEKLSNAEIWEDIFPLDKGNRAKDPKKVILPYAREKKFQTYGAKRIKRNNVEVNEKSPFNDYEFYIIPNSTGEINPDCIVIAERYYEDKYSGEEKLVSDNATYLFTLKDLTRISKKNKNEILSEMKTATDSRMKRVLHTKNWAKNLDNRIAELLGKKLESCYTKEELNEIETLSELIDGFKDLDGTYARIFDIEI